MMTNELIYKRAKIYFSIEELVSKKVFKKYGERSWKFLDPELLHTMVVIREGLGKKITVNTWKWGGRFSQRGLRSNLDSIFMGKFRKGRMYLSAHVLGKGIDFDVEGMSATEVRMWLKGVAKELPYKIRLEDGVNWCHLDVIWEAHNPKVYIFKP